MTIAMTVHENINSCMMRHTKNCVRTGKANLRLKTFRNPVLWTGINQPQNNVLLPSSYNIGCAMGLKSINIDFRGELHQHNCQIDLSCKSI